MSKSEWQSIGKKAGWMKTAQGVVGDVLEQIRYLLEKESEYKLHTEDISEINEPYYDEPGDNFVSGMSGREYQESLVEPFVDVLYAGNGEIKIYFMGNNAPSSVNAGQSSKYYINNLSIELLPELRQGLEQLGVGFDISEKTENFYKKLLETNEVPLKSRV